jgi:hypothetical protein
MHSEVALGVAATAVNTAGAGGRNWTRCSPLTTPHRRWAVVTVGEVGAKFVAIGS